MPGHFQLLNGEVAVVLNPVELKALLNASDGPVMRYVLVQGEKVKQRALQLVPRKTGNLAAHIVKRTVQIGSQAGVIVGVDGGTVPYAYWVHEGTPPHAIYPRNATRLVFFSQKLGKTIFMPPGEPVHHPGTKPNRYLRRALDVL